MSFLQVVLSSLCIVSLSHDIFRKFLRTSLTKRSFYWQMKCEYLNFDSHTLHTTIKCVSMLSHWTLWSIECIYTIIATTKCWCLCFQCDRDVCMRLLLQVKGVVSITFDMNRKRCIIRTKVDVRPEVSNILISVVCWLILAPYSLILKIIAHFWLLFKR